MDSRKQNPTVSWGISLHAPPLPPSVFVCRVQWSVYQSIHLPLVLPTLIHQPTLYCLISLSANLPSRICLTFPLSALSCQSVSPKGTVRTWMHLNADISVFFTQPGEIKQVMTPDLPLKIKKKKMSPPCQMMYMKAIPGWRGSQWYFDHLTFCVNCAKLMGGIYFPKTMIDQSLRSKDR